MKYFFWLICTVAIVAFIMGFKKAAIGLVVFVALIYVLAIVGGYFMYRNGDPLGKSESYPGWVRKV